MNSDFEIYKRENLAYEEAAKINHAPSDRGHKNFDQHQREFQEKQKLEQELTDYKSWEQYQKEQAMAFHQGQIETE